MVARKAYHDTLKVAVVVVVVLAYYIWYNKSVVKAPIHMYPGARESANIGRKEKPANTKNACLPTPQNQISI